MPVFLRHCETLCDIINSKGREGEIDMHDMFHRFTLDSIGAIAFGEVSSGSWNKEDPLCKHTRESKHEAHTRT